MKLNSVFSKLVPSAMVLSAKPNHFSEELPSAIVDRKTVNFQSATRLLPILFITVSQI